MDRQKYHDNALKAFNEGRVTEEVFNAMLDNADIFCDDDDDDTEYGLPATYAEVEYDDFDSYEAVQGARWDDMNYQHYMER